jgi:hypothetical protein
MNSSSPLRTWCAGLFSLAVAVALDGAWAGEPQPTASAPQPATSGPFRKLAPGVMQAIDPHLEEAETVSRHDVVELLAIDPNLDWAKDVAFRREVWFLELKFKPMRMIRVDVPQPGGRMKQKLLWYLAYSVTNPGKIMPSVEAAAGTYQLQDSDKPVLFVPEFRLESHEFGKVYRDRVIPIAVGPIQMREDPNRKLHNSVEMARNIKVGETVWGVATWEDLDPRIDRFSVYVNGLTNAYRWQDTPGAFKAGDPIGKGRRFTRKTLKLNFWRPGDEFYPHEKEFRFGSIPGEVDYEWVYR